MAVILLLSSSLVQIALFSIKSHPNVTSVFKVCVGLNKTFKPTENWGADNIQVEINLVHFSLKNSHLCLLSSSPERTNARPPWPLQHTHKHIHTHTRTLLVTGRSSFLIGYPPLPGGQHVVERVPADACSVERGQEGRDCWSTVSKCSYRRYTLCLNYSTVCRIALSTLWARWIFYYRSNMLL